MKKLAVICLLFVLFFIGCDSGSSSTTIDFELGSDGFVQWYTDDPYYYNSHPWIIYNDNINGTNTFQIECKKISGDTDNAYGMLFGAPNSVNDQFYYLAITTDGTYRVVKKIGETYTTIKAKTASDKLDTGYNKLNTLKVTRSVTTYTVYLNGDNVYDFTDSSITGDRVGFIVSVGPQGAESFPGTPVDVRFRQK